MKTLILLLLLIPILLPAYTAKVTQVVDGDTFKVITEEGKRITIRIHGIDCPEMPRYGKVTGQPGCVDATSYLLTIFALTNGYDTKTATAFVELDDTGKSYKRTVARVYVSIQGKKMDVAAILLRNGFAWHDTRYTSGDEAVNYERLFQLGKDNGIGIWTQGMIKKYGEPVAPWEWRGKRGQL